MQRNTILKALNIHRFRPCTNQQKQFIYFEYGEEKKLEKKNKNTQNYTPHTTTTKKSKNK